MMRDDSNCPPPERLAMFVEGRISGEERSRVIAHLAGCAACRDAAAAAVAFEEEFGASIRPLRPRNRRSTAAMAAAIAAVVAASACLILRPPSSRLGPVISAAGALSNRPFTARLSDFGWTPPPVTTRDASSTPKSDPQWLKLQGAAGDILGSAKSDAHDVGVARLLSGDTNGSLDALQKSANAEPKNPSHWSDLAAAWLADAERRNSHESALHALAAADHALSLQPAEPVALFNRALALEQLQLRAEARQAWEHYVAADPKSKWSNEAVEHLRKLKTASQGDLWKKHLPLIDDVVEQKNESDLAQLVRDFPQQSRTWGETIFLADWAKTRTQKQPTEHALTKARMLGAALQKLSGESMLADSVAAIDDAIAHHDEARLDLLAKGHTDYTNARRLYSFSVGRPGEALPLLEKSIDELQRAKSPLHLVARYYRANMLYDTNDVDGARTQLESLSGSFDATRFRALSAQIGWELGLCRLTRGEFAAARDTFAPALHTFEALHENENSAGMQFLLAESLDFLGESEQSWAHRVEGFRLHDLSGNDTLRQAALAAITRSLFRRNDLDAARSMAGVALESAERLKQPLLQADAYFQPASAAHHAGDDASALRDVASGFGVSGRIDDSELRKRSRADLAFARALARSKSDPAQALNDLADARNFYTANRNQLFLPRIDLERGRLLRSLQRLDEARGAFDSALLQLEQQRNRIAEWNSQAAMFAVGADDVLDEIVRTDRDRGQLADAFKAVERNRARPFVELMAARQRRNAPNESLEALQRQLTPSDAVIAFYATNDGIAAQVVRRDRHAERFHIAPRSELTETTNELTRTLSEQGDEMATRLAASRLYDLLLTPVANDLNGATHLVIIPDRSMLTIPFAALFDRARGQYAIEKFSLSYAASYSVLTSLQSSAASRGENVVVADPAFDTTRFPSLNRLPEAAQEGETIVRLENGKLLSGVTATPASVGAAVQNARRIHIAAHAIDDPRDPMHSALILAADRRGGLLEAGDVIQWTLVQSPVVILSACSSGRSEVRVRDGVPNIATAFLGAGASSVIATLWPIDDDSTTVRLMSSLHRRLDAGDSPARALQQVQLEALRSKSVSLREWAAFQVLGKS